MPYTNEDENKMGGPKRGDRVRYDWQGATVRGRVESVETEGEVRDSTGESVMEASEDNPVYRVRLLDDDGEDTEQVVVRRASSLEMDDTAMSDDDDDVDAAMPDDDEEKEIIPGARALPNVLRDAADRAKDVVAALGRAASLYAAPRHRDPTGLKVAGNQWVAVWSNNFADREGELFSQKAHDDYVARVDAGLTPPPELWVWHLPGTRVGAAAWVGRHDHFMLAGGTFDDTEAGRKAAAYYRTHGPTTALSHGFTYPADSFDGVTYNAYNTFEISLLPRGKEANRYTTLKGVMDMSLSEEKRQHLVKVFGDEAAAQMLADLEEAGKALGEAGVAYKDFATLGDGDETEAVREAAKALDTVIAGLWGDVLAGQADVAEGQAKAAKELANHATRIQTLEATVKALREEIAGRPRRATTDPATVVKDKSQTADRVREDIKQQTTRTHDFWGTQVSEEAD